jgi:diguanylate cyclase (GGDEF)-like protein/PAS domain S-box-containing protein
MASAGHTAIQFDQQGFEALVSLSSDIIAILDARGHITFVNHALQGLMGFTPHSVLNNHISEFLHPEDLATAKAAFEGTRVASERPIPVILRMRDIHGNYRVMEVVANNLLQHHPINGVLLNIHEVTGLIEIQEKLRASEARFRDVLENSAELIQSVDEDGRIQYANPAWKRVLGFSDAELADKTAFDVLVPEGREHCKSAFDRALHGRPIRNLALTLFAKNGQRIQVEGSLSCAREPGRSVTIHGIFHDVTAQNRTVCRLEEVGAVYHAILESLNYSIISTNTSGTILALNRAAEQMLGQSAGDMVGKLTPALVHDPEEVKKRALELSAQLGEKIEPGFRAFIAQTEKTGLADEREWTYIRKDGSRLPVSLFVNAMRKPTGEVMGYVSVATDITERKRADAEVRRAHHRVRVALEQEKDASRCDFMTGLNNRRAFYEMGEFEAKRAKRYQRAMTLVYIDVDNFKAVNDTQGHQAGDELLIQVGKTIKNGVRQTDITARLGGDEFVVLLPETDAAGGAVVSDKLHKTLAAEMEKNGWPVTFSLGCVTSNETHLDFDDLVKESDALMYQSKKSGKNRCSVAPVPGS